MAPGCQRNDLNKLKFVPYHIFLYKVSEHLINNQLFFLLTKRMEQNAEAH